MKIKVLMENHSEDANIHAEHGLCLYVETEKHHLLIDSGASGKTWDNAARMGVDLSLVDSLILSHGHYDHSGGIMALKERFPDLPIYMQRKAIQSYYHGERYIGIDPAILDLKEIHLLDGGLKLDEEVEIFSHISGRRFWPQSNLLLSVKKGERLEQDTFDHEQCVVIRGEKNILISGCAHNGILNIMDRYREIYGEDPDLVITGFHMMKKTEYRPEEILVIEETARELARSHTIYYSGHCTGDKAMALMKPILKEKLIHMYSGMVIDPDYKFDFSSIINREGKDALAVESIGSFPGAPSRPKEGFDFLPMWVADMNFATAPSITQAIIERSSHPLFGYFTPSKEYYDAIIDWQRERNGVEGLEEKHIGYENGVLGGVISAIRSYAEPGDSILLHSPTYIGFTGVLKSNGYHIVHSPLLKDEEGIYRMDYEDMDRKIKEHGIQVAIFCSPHNPTGRAWDQEEMEKAAAVYEKNQVTVICDEIWSDILLNGHRHIPFQMISDYSKEHTAAFYAPSKTFNLAGLVGSYHIIYNDKMRERIRAHEERSHYNSMNVLSMHALVGAYNSVGKAWTDELKMVLSRNINYACDYIGEHFEGVEVSKPEATYMLFLDCSKWCEKENQSIEQLLKAGWDVGVGWQSGVPFHGPSHIRMNLALPYERVREAMQRLKTYVFCK